MSSNVVRAVEHDDVCRALSGAAVALALAIRRTREHGIPLQDAEVFALVQAAVSLALTGGPGFFEESTVSWDAGEGDGCALEELRPLLPKRGGLRVVK